MADVIYGIDFKAKQRRPLTPLDELEKLACELMDVVWNPHDRAIYESSIGFVGPDKDSA